LGFSRSHDIFIDPHIAIAAFFYLLRVEHISKLARGLFSDRGDNCAADDDDDDVEEMKYKREMRLIFFFNFVYFRTFLHL